MINRETPEQALKRWEDLKILQDEYKNFNDFLWDIITELLKFKCTWLQTDIGQYVAYGPRYRMVQAQRGQAKTTITAIYAVWRLIHDPSTRVLIISSGSTMATEIANWVIQIINNFGPLACMRPDRMAGDRASVTAFDLHYSLRGAEKSPSIACVGITSNLQGKRADLLIADDVESQKNSQTQLSREQLLHLTRDFISICSKGDILYLGTPQSVDSIYNGLPGRGFDIRIWTGRYPTPKELKNYNGFLAPSLQKHMLDDPSLQIGGGPTGERGQPTDPVMLSEDDLNAKEIDQGAAYFQLQHMLDTRLMDEDRYPLKTEKIIFFHIPPEKVPLDLHWAPTDMARVHPPAGYPMQERFYEATGHSGEFAPFASTHMYVDPAGGGQNGDETAYSVTKFCNSRVFVVAAGGVKGGLDDDATDALTKIAVEWKPDKVDIEKNYGNGALSTVWQPKLLAAHRCAVEDVWETGQKELRIIDVLEPIIGAGRLVMDLGIINKDWMSCQKYSAEKRKTYSMLWQLSRITRDRNSLVHDDRLDALAGSCRHWVPLLALDKEKQLAKARADAYDAMVRNPLGNGVNVPGLSTQLSEMNSLSRFGV